MLADGFLSTKCPVLGVSLSAGEIVLTVMMDEVNLKLDEIMNKIESLTKSVDFLSKKYEEIKTNIKRSIEYQEILNKAVQKLKTENKEQKVEIFELNQRMEGLERKSLDSTFNLYPLLATEGQDLHEVLEKIGNNINLKLDKEVIVDVFRRPKKKSGKPGDVVVKCSSPKLRDEILNKIKRKKLLHTDIGLNCDLGRIYGNEELTKQGKDIYFAALKEKREKHWKYLWVKAGRSYVKKEEGGATFRLDSMTDLEKII